MIAHLKFLHVTSMHATLLDGLGVKVKLQDLTLLQELLESHLQSNDSFKLLITSITINVVHFHLAADEQSCSTGKGDNMATKRITAMGKWVQ